MDGRGRGRALTFPWCLIPASPGRQHHHAQQHGGEWSMVYASATCITSIHPDLSSKTELMTQLLHFQTAGSPSLFFFLFIFLFSGIFLYSLRDLSWMMLSKCAQIIQEVGKGTRDGRERARLAECKGNFFLLPRQTSIQIKSNYLPLVLQHCGIERSTEKARLQQWAHCGLIRALWARRPPLPAPREAPHTTALQGQ